MSGFGIVRKHGRENEKGKKGWRKNLLRKENTILKEIAF